MEGTELELMFRIRGPRYTLPEYQRGYSWKPDHVEQFLQDLEDAHDSDESYQHFFGYMLTSQGRPAEGKAIKIIDGQQRMTTATLFLICARNFFHTHEKSALAKRYLENLEERLYTTTRAEPDLNRPILTLSRTNNQLFLDLSRRARIGRAPPTNFRRIHDSNVLLHKAYKTIQGWFMSKIRDHKNGAGEGADPDALVIKINEYVLTLFGKFVIQRSHYGSHDEAREIFDLINNRGVGLTDSDLIKSYLFGKFLRPGGGGGAPDPQANPETVEHYDERWNDMRINVTGKDKSAYKDLDRFLAHYLVAFYGEKLPSRPKGDVEFVTQRPSQKQMHDAFKRLVEARPPADIIDDLHKWSGVLVSLRNPGGHAGFKKRANLVHYLKKIRDIDAVFMYPAILLGYQKYWEGGDPATFEALVAMCFKYHVRVKLVESGVPLPRYEQALSKITRHMRDNKLGEVIQYIVDEPRYYPTDSDVIGPLEQLHLRTSAHIVAVLEEAEYHGAEKADRGDVTVEHIMPKKFEAWEEYIICKNEEEIKSKDPKEQKKEAKKLHEDNFDCLGNLTLLSGKDNQAAATKPFADKLVEYEKHQTYKITKDLLVEKVWNVERIRERKKKLARAILEEIDLKGILDSLAARE